MNKVTVKTGLKIALVAGGVFALVPTVYGQGIGIQTLERLTSGTPQQLDRGEQVYEDQCATCHGDQGRGGAEIGDRMGADGFVNTDVERSGLKSIYSVIAHGYEYNDERHPVFDNLFHQDQWAVAHYVHNLIDDPNPDPPQVVERIREEARDGVCDPAIREEVAGLAEPEDEAQVAQGADIYEVRCATCHGDEGRGDGPGAGTVPPARDFHDPADEWTNGTSPLAIFNTLDQGIEGTAMTPFGHLPDDELWAMVHFVREEMIPEEEREELTEEQIDAVCRSLSAPPRPNPIPIRKAMEFLAGDTDEQRFLRYREYGDPVVHVEADPIAGQQLYQQSCASCHGADGQATESIGPYGSFPPYLHIEPTSLVPASVGGTYEDVAERTLVGPHAALPDRPSVAAFSEQDWMNLQAYITQFEGEGRDRVRTSDEVEAAEDEVDHLELLQRLDTVIDEDEREQLRDWMDNGEESLDDIVEALENADPEDLQDIEEALRSEEARLWIEGEEEEDVDDQEEAPEQEEEAEDQEEAPEQEEEEE